MYGDTKPQNVLVAAKGGIALLDLEQTLEGGDEAWDLAEFLYFSATRLEQDKKESRSILGKNRAEGMKLVAEAFLTGYRNENGVENIAQARSTRYFLPFVWVMNPKMTKVVRDALHRYSLPLH